MPGFFSSIFKKRAEDWFFAFLEPAQTPGNKPIENVDPDQHYLSIHLKSMRIVNVRKGFSKFYGTVHCFTSLPHLGGKPAEFNVLTTPGKLEELDAGNIDRVVNLNKRVFGPVPYRGGDLSFEAGLFSIKSADLAAPFISLLEQISALSGVSYISQALPFAEPLKNGINLLTGGADDTILEIGLSKEFTNVKTGYFVVMRIPKNELNAADIKVDATDFRLVYKDGRGISNYPYMVFEITKDDARQSWFEIPELQGPHQKLRDDVRKGDYEAANESLIAFKRTVLTCNDLITKDASQLYKKVEAEVKEILGTTLVADSKRSELRTLKEIDLYN